MAAAAGPGPTPTPLPPPSAPDTYKVLVLGDSNVGKTCIVHRYCDETYYDTYTSTIGIDFKQKIIRVDDVPVKMQIWDTAGQERYRTLTTAYYRGANGILLMYDVTNLDSFNNLTYWMKNIERNASTDVVVVLAGNKSDAKVQRVVDHEMGLNFAQNYDVPFYEVSCKHNTNIEEVFVRLARLIRDQKKTQGDHPDSGQNNNIRVSSQSKNRRDNEELMKALKCNC